MVQFLIADMGGTNIRFALSDGNKITALTHYKCAEFCSFSEAIKTYVKKIKNLPRNFILAVPGPVKKDKYSFVNNPWQFSLKSLKKEFGFERIHVVNDFEAAAVATPFLKTKDVVSLTNCRKSNSSAPRLIVGAGTGLGVGVLIPLENGKYKTIHSEGGHIAISDTNEQERKIKQFIIKKYGRASAERFVSGQGLQNIYQALYGKIKFSEEIVKLALNGDKLATQSLLQMFAFWGDIAGDLVLAFCATGGIYLTSSLFQTEGVLDLLNKSDFLNRFKNKGRYTSLMESIPIKIIRKKDFAFLGLKALTLP